ncbi:MAG: hypothetical protein BM564_13270 [Bacteroidetes bacterium MedPE-SWsnd-G2]|nr:MAG: hypothetical protein BM564_13270 [Bacteroidetes bacterium MedPE-SWsnd-G2]
MKQLSAICVFIFLFFQSTSAQNGSALHFDGTNDEVNCGNGTEVQVSGTTITLEAVVKIHAFETNVWEGNIINKEQGGPGTDYGYMLRVGANGTVNFNLGSGSWNEVNTPANTLSLDTWYHLAATFDGTDMKIFVDGVEIVSQSVNGLFIGNSSSNLVIGNWANGTGRNINATIDEIRIWDIARTETELLNSSASSLELPQTGLRVYYKFNQGMANEDNAAENTLTDELGAVTGDLLNFALSGTESNWVGDSALSLTEATLNSILMYPNPVNETLFLQGLTENDTYEIISIDGKLILEGTIKFDSGITVKHLNKGIYLLKIGDAFVQRFIKS